eukprot:m.55175 g.55175  ORF g.55175 m.55175 type:complete len:409 (-) comp10973_c0_seq1:687-1913(-)
MEGSPDCLICFLPLSDNRCCARCQQPYCSECISLWLHSSKNSCPACRNEAPVEEYVYNHELQQKADECVVPCEHDCGELIQWGNRREHKNVCSGEKVNCPFPGCSFVGLKGDMDRHTARCRSGTKYSIASIVQSILDRHRPDVDEPNFRPEGVSDAAFRAMLEQIQTSRAIEHEDANTDESVIRHYVQDGDTLTSVSVKYGTTPDVISRLNQLSSVNLFSVQYILVPRPKDYESEKLPEPSRAVLVAMRKRKLTNALVDMARRRLKSNLATDEAVTYLHLTDYDLDLAFKKFSADLRWAEDNKDIGARTFSAFLRRCQQISEINDPAGEPACFGCNSLLTALREHCRGCGAIYCYDCQLRGECNRFVEKSNLGVTCPSSKTDLVPVCLSCFNNIARDTASRGQEVQAV